MFNKKLKWAAYLSVFMLALSPVSANKQAGTCEKDYNNCQELCGNEAMEPFGFDLASCVEGCNHIKNTCYGI
jgi:hypothetical protein